MMSLTISNCTGGSWSSGRRHIDEQFIVIWDLATVVLFFWVLSIHSQSCYAFLHLDLWSQPVFKHHEHLYLYCSVHAVQSLATTSNLTLILWLDTPLVSVQLGVWVPTCVSPNLPKTEGHLSAPQRFVFDWSHCSVSMGYSNLGSSVSLNHHFVGVWATLFPASQPPASHLWHVLITNLIPQGKRTSATKSIGMGCIPQSLFWEQGAVRWLRSRCEYYLHSLMSTPELFGPSPCDLCLKNGVLCQVPSSSRSNVCTGCQVKKKRCSIKAPEKGTPKAWKWRGELVQVFLTHSSRTQMDWITLSHELHQTCIIQNQTINSPSTLISSCLASWGLINNYLASD